MNIRTEIRRLKEIKKMWIAETSSASSLKKDLGLTTSEIAEIKPTEMYDKVRYTKEDIAAYLKQKQLGQNAHTS